MFEPKRALMMLTICMICTPHEILFGCLDKKKNGIGEACGTFGRDRGCLYGVLVEIPEGKRPLVSPRNKWEDSLKMALKKVG
jgi:hypothetical protein